MMGTQRGCQSISRLNSASDMVMDVNIGSESEGLIQLVSVACVSGCRCGC